MARRERAPGPPETVLAWMENRYESAQQTLGLCKLSVAWVAQAGEGQDWWGGGALPPATPV